MLVGHMSYTCTCFYTAHFFSRERAVRAIIKVGHNTWSSPSSLRPRISPSGASALFLSVSCLLSRVPPTLGAGVREGRGGRTGNDVEELRSDTRGPVLQAWLAQGSPLSPREVCFPLLTASAPRVFLLLAVRTVNDDSTLMG